jgi:imidazolonepropionase-like amidohydrolase
MLALIAAPTLEATPAVSAPAYVLTNARIVSMSGPVIDSGTLVMRDGRIAAVGASVRAPADAIVLDASGWTLYPGFIDAHSSVGMSEPKEESARQAAERRARGEPTPALQANVRASASYVRDTEALKAFRQSGVAVAVIAPQAGILRGQSAVIALGDGRIGELLVKDPWAQHIGYEPISRQRNDYPGTLMGVIATIRQTLLDAAWYQRVWERWNETPDAIERPGVDASLAALGAAARNEQRVVFSAWSDNAILRTLGLVDELSLDAVVSGAIDGWRVADALAESGLPVLVSLDHRPRRDPVGFGQQPPGGLMAEPGAEDKEDARANGSRLHAAGVRFAFTSEGLESTDQFLPNLRAAVNAGLPQQAALEALTVNPARLLGLDASLGSLDVGKAAHVIAVDGDLFADEGRVVATWIDGRLYEASESPKKSASQKANEDDTAPAKPDLRAVWERTAPTGPLWPEVGLTAIRHATLLTVTHGTITPGTIIINEGQIQAVGPDSEITVPAGAREIDAKDMFVMPGIVDAHIHIAIAGGGNESTGAVTPEVRIADVIDHRSPSILRALAGGVTTVNVLHGSANVIGGQNAVIKLRWGKAAADLFVDGAQPGVKFALGENPKQTNRERPDGVPPRYPATRMGVELTLRTSFTQAQAYQAEWSAYEAAKSQGAEPLPPRRDLRLEALVGILDGTILVHAHCYRSDEILMLLRVAEDFGFRIASLQHVLEGYKVADEIAAHGAGGSTFADGWGYKMEAFDAIPYNASLMAHRGVVASINSDAVGEMTSRLYVQAAKAMKYGDASEEEALKMVTLNPASHLRLDHRIGSIDVGKDADLAIYTAHPFSAHAQVAMTLVDGQIYFDRDKVETTDEALQTSTSVASPEESSSESDVDPLKDRYVAWTPPETPSLTKTYGDIPGPILSSSPTLAIVGGRVVTMAGPVIESGTVLVRDGRVLAIGADVAVPSGAKLINAEGMTVTPGLINAGTTLGISEIGAVSATQDARELQRVNASVKASVAVHPHSEMLPVTRVNGVTTALSAPSGGLISGQAALIDLAGWTAPELVAKSPVAMMIHFPESLELSPDEKTRKSVADERKSLRDWMRRARAYAGALGTETAVSSEDDDELRALVPVVRGELPVVLEAESEEGIRAALAFADELELDAILAGTRDIWRSVDVIAGSGVAVILGPIESAPAPGDPYDAIFKAASLLQNAGVPIAFRTGGATNARNLPYTAGMAVAFGLSREQAWHAMTRGAAEILGVGDDYGTLEVGKIANVVVADGDLLDVPTQVRHVVIRGQLIELSSRHTKLYEQFKARPAPASSETDANP